MKVILIGSGLLTKLLNYGKIILAFAVKMTLGKSNYKYKIQHT